MFRLAIIGFGATGLSLLAQLITALNDAATVPKLEITIFNAAGGPGRGLAYGFDSDDFRLNMRNDTMSIWPDRPSAFAEYLAKCNSSAAPDAYSKRSEFGQYLTMEWENCLKSANELGISVSLVQRLVTDFHKTELGYQVLTDGCISSFNAVVLAVGNLPPNCYTELRSKPNYLHSCYRDFHPSVLADTKSVGVLGSSLTAIDTALHIVRTCRYNGKVTLFSRQGLLPRVQPDLVEPVTYFNEQDIELKHVKSLDDVVKLFQANMPAKKAHEL